MIDQYPSPNGVLTSLIWRKTAAGGETSLSGYDNASQALSYTPGQEQVYLNGILLVRGSDYTATNGTSITGLSALAADDFVQINCYNNFSVASVPAASITGTVTNAQLQNSSITINGSAVSLGGSVSLAGDIESVTASSPLTGGGSTGALTIGIQSASTTQSGAVQLSDSTSTTSSVLAATPTAVKSAYDLANGAIPKTLTTTTGDIIYASGDNTPARLGIGSSGNILTVSGGVPVWSAPAGGGGKVLQVVQATTSTYVSIASTSYTDTGLTGTITPTLSTSKILVMATQGFGVFNSPDSANFSMGWKLARNIGGGSFSFVYTPTPNNNELWRFGTIQQLRAVNNLVYLDSPATTSAVTYKLQAQTNSTANNQSVNFQNENAQTSVIIMMEIGV